MKAAVVVARGKAPVYRDFADPVPAGDERLISVAAAALSPVTRSRAAGAHYSSSAEFPFVAGVAGVGRLDDGRRVYFLLPRAPFGGMAEKTVAREAQLIEPPDDLDDIAAAAIANPGMSSWVALKERAKLKPGETVLVNGATGAAGRLAVQIARHLGASRVVATGRNLAALKATAALGADSTVHLVEDKDSLEEAFKSEFAAGIDIVLDYLWGSSAERLLAAVAKAGRGPVPIRFVQIGSMSGANITLSSDVLRSSAIEILGSGFGSIRLDDFLRAIGELLRAAAPAGFRIETRTVPLSEVEQEWSRDSGRARIVFRIGEKCFSAL